MTQRSQSSSRGRRRHNNDSDEEMPAPSYTAEFRRKSKAKARASQADPSQNDSHSETQGSQRPGANKLDEEEETHLVGIVIKYLLAMDRSKHLIQRAQIIKNALPNHSKHFKQIMAAVSKNLKEVFGFNLVELDHSKYILTNAIDNSDGHLDFSKDTKKEMVLCFIVLAHIFMSGSNGCTEDDIFKLLRALNIIKEDDVVHDYFGNVKSLITEKFVKQGYLEAVVLDKADPPIKNYQWGPRAEKELTHRQILEFMSKIYGGRALNTWSEQFKIMQEREDDARNSS